MRRSWPSATRSALGFLRLADEDAAAFDRVMAAYRLPRETEEEQGGAAAPPPGGRSREPPRCPLMVARRAVYVMGLAGEATSIGNPNAASDGLSGAARAVRRPRWRHCERADQRVRVHRCRRGARSCSTTAAVCGTGPTPCSPRPRKRSPPRPREAGCAAACSAAPWSAMRIDAVVFDCRDAAPLARFWAAALGWQVAPYDEEELASARREGDRRPRGRSERDGGAARGQRAARSCSSPR